jgi:hypothetical protein
MEHSIGPDLTQLFVELRGLLVRKSSLHDLGINDRKLLFYDISHGRRLVVIKSRFSASKRIADVTRLSLELNCLPRLAQNV